MNDDRVQTLLETTLNKMFWWIYQWKQHKSSEKSSGKTSFERQRKKEGTNECKQTNGTGCEIDKRAIHKNLIVLYIGELINAYACLLTACKNILQKWKLLEPCYVCSEAIHHAIVFLSVLVALVLRGTFLDYFMAVWKQNGKNFY